MQILMFYKKCPQGFLKSEVIYWKHEEAWSTCQLPRSRMKKNTLVQTTKKADLGQRIKEILFQIDRQTHTQTYYKIFILDHKWFEKQCSRGSATSEVTRNKSRPSSKKKLYFTTALKMQSWVAKHRYPTLLTMYKGKSTFIIK